MTLALSAMCIQAAMAGNAGAGIARRAPGRASELPQRAAEQGNRIMFNGSPNGLAKLDFFTW